MTCRKNYLGLLVISDQDELDPEPRLEGGTAYAAALPGTIAWQHIIDSKGKETFEYVVSTASKSS